MREGVGGGQATLRYLSKIDTNLPHIKVHIVWGFIFYFYLSLLPIPVPLAGCGIGKANLPSERH